MLPKKLLDVNNISTELKIDNNDSKNIKNFKEKFESSSSNKLSVSL